MADLVGQGQAGETGADTDDSELPGALEGPVVKRDAARGVGCMHRK